LLLKKVSFFIVSGVRLANFFFFQPKEIPVRFVKKEPVADKVVEQRVDQFIVENRLERAVFRDSPLPEPAVRAALPPAPAAKPSPSRMAAKILQSVSATAAAHEGKAASAASPVPAGPVRLTLNAAPPPPPLPATPTALRCRFYGTPFRPLSFWTNIILVNILDKT
jgi:hypothetical protein